MFNTSEACKKTRCKLHMQKTNQPYSRKVVWSNNRCYLKWELKSWTTLGVLTLCSIRASLLDQTSSVAGLACLTSPLAGIGSFIIALTIVMDNKSTKWGRKNIQTN